MAYIKKKKDDAYLITVSCGRDSSGKKITRSTTFSPEIFTAKGNRKTEKVIEKEVAAYAAEFERKVLTGHYTEGHTMTFEEYSQKYLSEYARINQAPRTYQSTETTVKSFVSAFGYMTLESLNPLFLQEYFNTMLSTRKLTHGSGTLSQSTVKRRAAVLSSMLSQAVRWNLVEQNVMQRVQIKKAEVKEEKPMCFTQEQAEIFLDALEKPLYYEYDRKTRKTNQGNICEIQAYRAERQIHLQLKFFFYLAIFTGCRRGELVPLRWSDIAFDDSSIRITKSACMVKGELLIKGTKTKGSIRTIAIPAAVLSLARCWKREQALYRLTIGSQWIGDDFVFIRWNGSMMGLDTPYHAFRRIIRNYNANRKNGEPELPLIPLHGLRHTSATLLISQGIDIRTVSGRLGHTNTSTTLNIYSHALKELDKTASDKLESIFLKKTN